jgi:thiol-disulfide isomerase/thioredoxin
MALSVSVSAGEFSRLEPVPTAPAPSLALKAGDVEPLAAYAGKPVVVNFWATWCEPCRDEMPALDMLRDRRPDIGVVAVAMADSESKVKAFAEDYLLSLPLVLDPQQSLGHRWGVRVLPTTFVLDAAHRVRDRAVGPLDWYAASLERLLDGLKAGQKSN